LPRYRSTVFAREFQYHIPTKREANQINLAEAVALDQLRYNVPKIIRESRVIERGRQVLGPATVSIVHPHHAQTGCQSLFRGAKHVPRIRRAFHPVNQNKRRLRSRIILPRAMSQHSHTRRRVEEARLAAGVDYFETPPNEISRESLRVSVLQSGVRNEGVLLKMLDYVLFNHSRHALSLNTILVGGSRGVQVNRFGMNPVKQRRGHQSRDQR